MNDRSDLEFLVTDWLRAAAPARAPDRVLASTLSRVADVGQTRPFGGRRFDDWIGASPRLHWAIVGALLAAALLTSVVRPAANPMTDGNASTVQSPVHLVMLTADPSDR